MSSVLHGTWEVSHFFLIYSGWHLALSLSVYITVASLRIFLPVWQSLVWNHIWPIQFDLQCFWKDSEDSGSILSLRCLMHPICRPRHSHFFLCSCSITTWPFLFSVEHVVAAIQTWKCSVIQYNVIKGGKKKQAITGTTRSTHCLCLSWMLLFRKRFEGF